MKQLSIIPILFTFQFAGLAEVGIVTMTPSTSAALDVTSTSQGFLPPRMANAQRIAILSPALGLMIYYIYCGGVEIEVYSGIDWRNMIGGSEAPALAIGDSYGGGKVAYIFQTGDPGYISGQVHGLIAAVSDQSTGAKWGCYQEDMLGAKGMALGTGNQNTIDIVTECSTGGIAARICDDLELEGYSDWYLPSKDELNKLYLNKVAIGGFENSYYWSSSEIDSYGAWRQLFTNGGQANFLKNYPYYVRAVRAF